jgi:pyruvate/2-oxoglutarate/acetoin dehydrogenase E1 component
MGGALHLLRGMHILEPRDFTRAAGFYNTLLAGDDPALVVEVLNGYRVREPMPDNIGELRVPLGLPEILRPGGDVTLVTYGACCRIALEAARQLAAVEIDVEVIDVQSLSPFDLRGVIGSSLQKTGRVAFLDEDVPGGATAYMLNDVIERQGGYFWLDAPPLTLCGMAHRPAYGSDGDYFSKPSVDSVFDALYDLMGEADPARYPRYDR